MSTEVERAEAIARYAHAGQRDTVTGADYITHVERVVSMVEGDDAKAVAWLHDVLEDSPVTDWELYRADISRVVIDAVSILTRREAQTYADYIDRVKASGDRLALTVKLADLRDHLQPNCPERLRPRYDRALLTLSDTESR